MPTRPPADGVIKHQLMFKWRGQWCVTTFWVLHDATPTQVMCDADRAVLKNWCDVHWQPNADTGAVAREIKSWSMETATPTKFAPDVWYPLTHITGTLGGSGGIQGVTYALSLRTGAEGALPKPPSGRIYHIGRPVIGDYEAGNSRVTGACSTALEAAYTALITAFTGVGDIGVWVVMSYQLGGSRAAPAFRATPLALPITRIRSEGRVDFQRRRLPRQQSYLVN